MNAKLRPFKNAKHNSESVSTLYRDITPLNTIVIINSSHGIVTGKEVLSGSLSTSRQVPILGLYENRSLPLSGRIAVYGDSNCIDGSHMQKECYWLMDALLEFTMHGQVN